MNWNKLFWWQKAGLVMLAEALWLIVIFTAVSFALWDFSTLITWSTLRFIVAMWAVTLLVMGGMKGYETLLKNQARKENDS